MKNIKIVKFDLKGDDRGTLISLESNTNNVPFNIERVYYIFGNKPDVIRGNHAHIDLEQVIVCVKGSCAFSLDDGLSVKKIELNSPDQGLYIGNDIWRSFTNFSHDCVIMVLASKKYNVKDYINDYYSFYKIKNKNMIIQGASIRLREANIDDADFIFNLRCNQKKTKFLNPITGSVEDQKKFLSDYEKKLDEFYFIIEDNLLNKIGTIRIYDILNGNDFCWGSWILSDKASKTSAIQSCLLLYEFAFFKLNFLKAHFDVRKNNDSVIRFHTNFGAKIVNQDEKDLFFSFKLEDYISIRKKYKKWIINNG